MRSTRWPTPKDGESGEGHAQAKFYDEIERSAEEEQQAKNGQVAD
jgi:hypothetical protein